MCSIRVHNLRWNINVFSISAQHTISFLRYKTTGGHKSSLISNSVPACFENVVYSKSHYTIETSAINPVNSLRNCLEYTFEFLWFISGTRGFFVSGCAPYSNGTDKMRSIETESVASTVPGSAIHMEQFYSRLYTQAIVKI